MHFALPWQGAKWPEREMVPIALVGALSFAAALFLSPTRVSMSEFLTVGLELQTDAIFLELWYSSSD